MFLILEITNKLEEKQEFLRKINFLISLLFNNIHFIDLKCLHKLLYFSNCNDIFKIFKLDLSYCLFIVNVV